MSMVAVGRQHLNGALRGGMKSTELEQKRNAANKQLKQAERQQTMSTTASGAMVGAYFGPVGAVVGAAVGFIAGELF